jgi:ABC-type uncharacterized transport system auxiliary subunit
MKILSITLTLIFLSACSSGGKVVDKTYYRFPTTNQTATGNNYTIEKPTAMGILGNRPMVVQDANGGMIQMSHNLWLESPKILLHEYLKNTFIQNNNTQEFILKTQILNLEKKGSNSILTIKIALIDQQKQILFSKTYNYEESLEINSIPFFVKSISDSLHKMTEQLINDLP